MKIKAWLEGLICSNNVSPNKTEKSTVSPVSIVFFLVYKNDKIGTLNFTGESWVFTYSDWFKGQSDFKPFANFPDVNREYVSENLPPFFESRIPGLSQPQVEAFLQGLKLKKSINDEETKVALLKEFGRRSITNPFELKPAL